MPVAAIGAHYIIASGTAWEAQEKPEQRLYRFLAFAYAGRGEPYEDESITKVAAKLGGDSIIVLPDGPMQSRLKTDLTADHGSKIGVDDLNEFECHTPNALDEAAEVRLWRLPFLDGRFGNWQGACLDELMKEKALCLFVSIPHSYAA